MQCRDCPPRQNKEVVAVVVRKVAVVDRWSLVEVRLYLATAKKNLKIGKDTRNTPISRQ